MSEKKYKALPIYTDTHAKVKRLAFETGRPMVEVVEEAIDLLVSKTIRKKAQV